MCVCGGVLSLPRDTSSEGSVFDGGSHSLECHFCVDVVMSVVRWLMSLIEGHVVSVVLASGSHADDTDFVESCVPRECVHMVEKPGGIGTAGSDDSGGGASSGYSSNGLIVVPKDTVT